MPGTYQVLAYTISTLYAQQDFIILILQRRKRQRLREVPTANQWQSPDFNPGLPGSKALAASAVCPAPRDSGLLFVSES